MDKSQVTIKEKRVRQIMEELTLILMWLTRFTYKRSKDKPLWRAWKGYDFDILDSLLEKEYISFSYKSKSIQFRDKGINKARRLLGKYFPRILNNKG